MKIVLERQVSPLPLIILYALVGSAFFVYFPVIYSGQKVFVLILDFLLSLALLFTTFLLKKHRRVFGGSRFILYFILLYLVGIAASLSADPAFPSLSELQGLRSHLFGLIVFLISSIWITSNYRLNVIIKIILICSIISSIYGAKQIFFGMTSQELNHLSMMGSSVAEIEVLNRFRIPSIFGDPATYSFFIMGSVFTYFLARQRRLFLFITQKIHPLLPILLFGSLVSTLTRAPLLGLFVGFCFYRVYINNSIMKRAIGLVKIILVLLSFFIILTILISSNILSTLDIEWLNQLNNGLSSIWSIFSMLIPGYSYFGDKSLEFLSSTSAGARTSAWIEASKFIINNPLGGGVGFMNETGSELLSFSTVDVGYFRYGIETGILSMVGMLGLMTSVFLDAVRKLRHINVQETKHVGYMLLGLWVSFIVASGVTGFLFVESVAVFVWTIAGVLVNLDTIASAKRLTEAPRICQSSIGRTD